MFFLKVSNLNLAFFLLWTVLALKLFFSQVHWETIDGGHKECKANVCWAGEIPYRRKAGHKECKANVCWAGEITYRRNAGHKECKANVRVCRAEGYLTGPENVTV